MRKTVPVALFLLLFTWFTGANAQRLFGKGGPAPKKLVTIPGADESSSSSDFCICKIVNYSTENQLQRTDAIFAGSNAEQTVRKKILLKNIKYELQQALIFFDSYKVVSQYASPVDCYTLYNYLKKRENINRFTVLLPSYASR